MTTTATSEYRGKREYHRVFSLLIATAEQRGLTTYTPVAARLGITQPGNHMSREVGRVLGEIVEDEHERGRPMLSAVVVRSGLDATPGPGFYVLARHLGRLASTDFDAERRFWEEERERVYDTWQSPLRETV